MRILQIPISKWEDLTDDDEAIKTLRDVNSHNVEDLDLLMGMTEEKKLKCFAISKTSFFIFLLMSKKLSPAGWIDIVGDAYKEREYRLCSEKNFHCLQCGLQCIRSSATMSDEQLE
ncbi:Alpha-dioxygenase 2 [Capsicum baccatum]|uniref:Alpha-dioxygenase 2 n=1 Tax=Capsicum baccatum TaxID=33114 RepID=A0A2G2WWY8_CAPBA|nr:Alpha-dioxygenase 2 [Capsicum baccatum]